jgi:hypothetical protein
MRERVDQMHQDYHAHVRKRELLVRYQEKVNTHNSSVISTTSSTLPRQQLNLSRQMKGMTESQLEYLLEKRLALRRERLAALRIQRIFRGYRARKAY